MKRRSRSAAERPPDQRSSLGYPERGSRSRNGFATAARNQVAELVGEQRVIKPHACDPVVRPADLAVELALVNLDGDRLADAEARAAEVADADSFRRQLDHQSVERFGAGLAEPYGLSNCVALVCADCQYGHRTQPLRPVDWQ